MRFKSREIESALKKKGFIEVRNGDHKHYYFVDESGYTFLKTRVSHGNPEYSGRLLSSLMKQLHLNSSQLQDLVNCPLTKDRLHQIYEQEMEIIEKQKLEILNDSN
ncbi:type II toxin-antitoxin system HicA family toxin [Methanimicrococcus blatticola]|uniref:HicA-like toxin of HicAB toxin-antitoxin system n=1 Tax=Methanimicrococcus blatticola TaxID=91560 RepID=A0A484F5F9_9EURY|nr:type II toxin-antitoxin system HicA family toxin [Methanimicrococcus blatticola]MBZ3935513.1 type II toxin-antitoxin system HicA family toxin [Methanimicrococcus blatticola]MCC2509156.1 type II toxin-antitoxin system HicA family toxin [Methanimicrococcus blatticola]TDQ69479.1 HicA-like toxin of HicAB toxin-antitoxin system [Methanimicrococcus blatticola]